MCFLSRAELYSFNIVNTVTLNKLIYVILQLKLTYDLEYLTSSTREIEPIKMYYQKLLWAIQALPPKTANAAYYLIIGALPIEATIHNYYQAPLPFQ